MSCTKLKRNKRHSIWISYAGHEYLFWSLMVSDLCSKMSYVTTSSKSDTIPTYDDNKVHRSWQISCVPIGWLSAKIKFRALCFQFTQEHTLIQLTNAERGENTDVVMSGVQNVKYWEWVSSQLCIGPLTLHHLLCHHLRPKDQDH